MTARKAFLSGLTKMQGPTPLITTLSRFHYWLDQYRIHRDVKCPPEYAALSAKKIETLLASEKCAERRIRLCQALASRPRRGLGVPEGAARGGAAAVLAKIALNDPDEQVARNAATALGNVHTDEAVRLLIDMSQSAKRMPVRLASLHSLRRTRRHTRSSVAAPLWDLASSARTTRKSSRRSSSGSRTSSRTSVCGGWS